MMRVAIRLFGHLLLAGAALSLLSSVQHGGQEQLVYAAAMTVGWIACLALVVAIDLAGRAKPPPCDPYEAHPKMSPSVQPRAISYRKLAPR